MKKYDIDERIMLDVNGDRQSVRIIGTDRNNPVMLFLHGGPGFPNRQQVIKYQNQIAEFVTIVCWDQRGTGKSFNRLQKRRRLTAGQMIEDTCTVIDYLRERFNQDKIYIAGQMWGSLLGVLVAKAAPEKIMAYIGISQLVDVAENEVKCYEFTLDEAERLDDRHALKELCQITPPEKGRYVNMEQMETVANYVSKYGGEIWSGHRGFFNNVFLPIVTSREYNLFDLFKLIKGISYSINEVWDEMSEVSLLRSMERIDVPIYITQGRHDHNSDSGLAHQWYEKLKAPEKEWIWFENSASWPYIEEADYWTAIIKEIVVNKSQKL